MWSTASCWFDLLLEDLDSVVVVAMLGMTERKEKE